MGNFATQNVIFPSVMHHQLAPKLMDYISMLRILEEFARAPAPPVAAAEHVPWIVKKWRETQWLQGKKMEERELA